MEELMNEFSKLFMNVILPIVGTIVSYYVMVLIKKFETMTKIDIRVKTEEMLKGLAEQGVQYAAELSAKHSKEMTGSIRGAAKLVKAVDFVMDKIDLNIPETKITTSQAEEYVTSALARIAGEGATKDKVLK